MVLLVWADNLYVAAETRQELQRSVNALDERLRADGIPLCSGELLRGGVVSREPGDDLPFVLSGGAQCPVVEELNVSGVALGDRGSTGAMLREREKQCDKFWHVHGGLLLAGGVPEDAKLRTIYTTLGQRLLHGSALWTLDKRTRDFLSRKEGNCSACVLVWKESQTMSGYHGGKKFIVQFIDFEPIGVAPAYCNEQQLVLGDGGDMWQEEVRGLQHQRPWSGGAWSGGGRSRTTPRGVRHEKRGWHRQPEHSLEAWAREAAEWDWKWMALEKDRWRETCCDFVLFINRKLRGPKMPRRWRKREVWREAMEGLQPWQVPEGARDDFA